MPLAVFVLGLLAAWIDIDSFFRSKRVSYVAWRAPSFRGFVLFNGAMSAAILVWSLSARQTVPLTALSRYSHYLGGWSS